MASCAIATVNVPPATGLSPPPLPEAPLPLDPPPPPPPQAARASASTSRPPRPNHLSRISSLLLLDPSGCLRQKRGRHRETTKTIGKAAASPSPLSVSQMRVEGLA